MPASESEIVKKAYKWVAESWLHQDNWPDLVTALCVEIVAAHNGRADAAPTSKHATRLEMSDVELDDLNDLDDVIHVLGVEDSHVTPAGRAREWLSEIENLRAQIAALSSPQMVEKMARAYRTEFEQIWPGSRPAMKEAIRLVKAALKVTV